ncbi:MAG: sigma-70 family RNA polymerase sigma factor [Gammaproteobacteria bacterium]|jgi:RNA polymerase sigma-70 factor (ECF subfamily)|nr:sigma-70 family RNA polymerase sigma factor [Gammaproteobacteria bacterium]
MTKGKKIKKIEDSILFSLAREETGAFEKLVDQYGNLIWSIARRYLSNQTEAEDAVQEVFIAIWKSAGRFDPTKASEVTFVSMIARRRLIDHLRKIYRHKNLEPIDDCFDDDALETKSILDKSADVQIISEAINQFAEEDKQLLSLSIYQGYSHSEISKLMNIPLGTVKTKIRRNLIQLRETFDQDQNTVVSIHNA